MEKVGQHNWDLVYQSRSGRPDQPWLEPDVCDHIQAVASTSKSVVIVPIGFISDHMEIMFDLDEEAQQLCDDLGIEMQRAKTVGTHPRFASWFRRESLDIISSRWETSGHRMMCALWIAVR